MNPNRFNVRRAVLGAIAVGAAVLAAGCSDSFDDGGPYAHDVPPYADSPRAVDPGSPALPQPLPIGEPPKGATDLDPTTVRACASFVTVEHLVQRTVAPDKRPDGTARPASNLIDLADTVNSTRDQGLSDALDRAFTAYAYALTSLGAHIDHKQPADEISEMIQVVNNNGAVIKALCREPSSDTYGGIGESIPPRESFETEPFPGGGSGWNAPVRKSAER